LSRQNLKFLEFCFTRIPPEVQGWPKLGLFWLDEFSYAGLVSKEEMAKLTIVGTPKNRLETR
jgi:hypothetical protein